ncbi:hypothetical protein TNCV_714071, partial [Trichonephila clavipes]
MAIAASSYLLKQESKSVTAFKTIFDEITISDAEKQGCKSSYGNLRRASTFQDLSNVDIKIVNCEWKSTSDMIYNTPQGMLQPGLYPSSANKEPFSLGRIFFVIYYENQEENLHLFIKEVAFIQ